MSARVLKPGLSSTVQDLGRYGYAHLGISPCGAADSVSFRIANLLMGNGENTPALEMTLAGATLEFTQGATIAIAGANCECKLGQYRIPANTAIHIQPGGVLQCGSIVAGARSYLAVQGGFAIPQVMGSASTDLRGVFGGIDGRRLREGDVIMIGPTSGRRTRRLRSGISLGMQGDGLIRVTRGAQQDWFDEETFERFFAGSYTVSEQSDRAGLRLIGDKVSPLVRKQLLTDGIPLGAIQVPQDGQPILLFVDQQTTGGYPKIANVIAADVHHVGQLRPRDEIRFAEVTIEDAIAALETQERWLRGIWDDQAQR